MNDAASAEQREGKSDQSREAVRAVIREVMGVPFVAATLFIPAWRLNWAMGWALVGLYAIWVGATALILIPNNPELLIERATRRREGAKTWEHDKGACAKRCGKGGCFDKGQTHVHLKQH